MHSLSFLNDDLQGNILGPPLFTFYIKYVFPMINCIEIKHFGDDNVLHMSCWGAPPSRLMWVIDKYCL